VEVNVAVGGGVVLVNVLSVAAAPGKVPVVRFIVGYPLLVSLTLVNFVVTGVISVAFIRRGLITAREMESASCGERWYLEKSDSVPGPGRSD
jgi:hypothetical protein